MTFTVVVRPDVDADLREAEVWYEQQEPGLGRRFLQDILATIDRLVQNPFLYFVRYRRYQVRWAYARKFPYRVIFTVIDEVVVIYAVTHRARHDRNWKARITS